MTKTHASQVIRRRPFRDKRRSYFSSLVRQEHPQVVSFIVCRFSYRMVDLQLVSLSRHIFGKGQTSLITDTPVVFLIEDDAQITYKNLFELAHQRQAPYDFAGLINLLEELWQLGKRGC